MVRAQQARQVASLGYPLSIRIAGAHLPPALRGGVFHGHAVGGLSLSDLLKRFEPKSQAAYLEFETLYRPDEMPGTPTFTSTID
jgi:hypothetical protein